VSLNLQDSSDRQEARLLALFGIVLQLAVLTFFAAMIFHPHFSLLFLKDGSPAAAYAFPFATSGTIMLVSGLLICSHVVEASTEEEHYMLPDASPRIQTYWRQQQQTVATRVSIPLLHGPRLLAPPLRCLGVDERRMAPLAGKREL